MIIKLFLTFTIVSLTELALLIWIGKHLGVMVTIGLVILTAVIGATMAKREGMRVWGQLRNQLRAGNLPGNTILEGVLIFAGGITFLTPGFLTDSIGILCLIPVTRRLFLGWFKTWLKDKLRDGEIVWFQYSSGYDQDTRKDSFESEVG